MTVADLSFANNECEKLCSSRREAQKRFGEAGAKKLGRRVKELQSTPDAETLKQGPGKWHDLHYDWEGYISGTITGGDRIVVKFTIHTDGYPVWHVVCVGDCYKH